MIQFRGRHRKPCGQGKMRTVLVIAVVGIVAAGGVWYYRWMERTRAVAVARQQAAATQAGAKAKAGAARKADEPREVSTAPDPAEVRTPMVILSPGKDARSAAVVALGRSESPRYEADYLGTRQGLLDRELVHQALLMAARDELGLSTRDVVLDDAEPARGDGPPIEVVVLFRNGECHALVRRGAGEKAEILEADDLGTMPDSGPFILQLAGRTEELARTKFPALLKRLGLNGRPNPIREDATVSPDIDRRLETLGLVDHFAAIRSLHEAIRTDGESPARLSALARAYAQLGLLTEYQWSPAHRAFKARALLYAHRLRARQPDSPFAVRTLAFVLAMIGRPYNARLVLDRAEGLDTQVKTAGKPPVPMPSWLPVVEAYLKADRDGLTIKDGPHTKLAALLRMLTLEYPRGTRVFVQSARSILSIDADCQRAYDAICAQGQLGDLHAATLLGPDAFTKLFPVKMRSIGSLPGSLKPALDQDDELAIVEALDQAGRPGVDRGELPWGVLAHLAREARFTHAFRRLHFMAYKWSVPTAEYFQDIRPFVEHHRYFGYLEFLGLPPQQGIPALTALGNRMNLADLEVIELPMLEALRQIQFPAYKQTWDLANYHATSVVRDACERIANSRDAHPFFASMLMRLDPYSAFAMGKLVEGAWDQSKQSVSEWRQKVGDAPALIGALGRKYVELKQYDEAEKLLRRYMELSPDRWAYVKLAECYKARGDADRWKSTLDEYLAKTESAGLEHAEVQVQIANDLMDRGRFAEAKPYAETAAETWANWAMQCAARCNEGLKDWERAELWTRRTTERYPDTSWPLWYLFCKRTGRGDLAAATDFAREFVATAADRPELVAPTSAGLFLWSIGLPRQAMPYLIAADTAAPAPLEMFCVALIADELGDKALRDRSFQQYINKFQGSAPLSVALVQQIVESLADGGGRPLDEPAVDRKLAEMPPAPRGNASFLVGRFLMKRRPEAARKYLKAADTDETSLWLRVLAIDSLRSLEAKPTR